jgi:riboflavin synthase
VFTGLVATVGTLQLLSEQLVRISNAGSIVSTDLAIGDSVAVDGVCLTVTEVLPTGFVATISPETISRTVLGLSGQLSDGGERRVNLEPSLRVGSKLGGHFVTGHIDGVGYLEASIQSENAWEMSFQVSDARVARYIVPKGSIAVNGISLTVAECSASGDWFKVAVIPHTYAETNLQQLQPGSPVNLEGDVLGKYVEKFLRLGHAAPAAIGELEQFLDPSAAHGSSQTLAEQLSPAFLAEHGYL